jgi:diguanylate cyclase (GGDEF)-like protein/PAS domain S-box-containing protein
MDVTCTILYVSDASYGEESRSVEESRSIEGRVKTRRPGIVFSIRRYFRNLSLTAQLTITYGTAFIAIALLTAAMYTNISARAIRDLSIHEGREYASSIASTLRHIGYVENEATLKTRAEMARIETENIIEGFGRLSVEREDMRDYVYRYLSQQPTSNDSYFYAVDEYGVVRHHPFASLLGADVTGQEVFDEIERVKNGFIRYRWANPNDPQPRRKTGFVVFIDDVDLYVVASSYPTNVFTSLAPGRLRELLDGLENSFVPAIVLRDDELRNVATSAGFEALSTRFPETDEYPGDEVAVIADIGDGLYVLRDTVPGFEMYVDIVFDSQEQQNVLAIVRRTVLVGIVLVILSIILLSRTAAIIVGRPLFRLNEKLARRVPPEARPGRATSPANLNDLIRLQLRLVTAIEREQRVRKDTEQRLVRVEAGFFNTSEGVVITDSDGTILQVNPAFEKITGYTAKEATGQNPRILKSTRHDDAFYADMWNQISQAGHWSGEIWNRAKDGHEYVELLTISKVDSSQSNDVAYVAIFHDITEMREVQGRMRYMASHDGLTGLPNRSYLEIVLEQTLRHASRNKHKFALMFLDLDNFKDVNDSLGHHAGDELLKTIAQRIETLLRDDDVVARFGGDEFVVLISEVEDRGQVSMIARKILTTIQQPYSVQGHTFRPSASIGIAMYPDSAYDTSALLQNADVAMYDAKRENKNDFRFHDPEMNRDAHRRLAMRSRITSAIDEREIRPVYQPLYSFQEDKIVGVEALARWYRAGTVVPPIEFLPYIEGTGTISRLDLWILESAIREVGGSPHLPNDLYVSVNIAPIGLQTPDFVDRLLDVIDTTGFDPHRLRIEMTEASRIKDIGPVQKSLQRIKSAGVGLYLDDFGEGYSSIRYLREFGFDAVKLDKQYLDATARSADARSLVSGFVQLAHGIGISAIVEGVETAEHVSFLAEIGTDCGQGYFFGRPAPLHEFETLLRGSEE